MTIGAQLADDAAAILAAAVALCFHARPVVVVPYGWPALPEVTPQSWWDAQTEMERRLHIGRARVACSAWEDFWKGKGR